MLYCTLPHVFFLHYIFFLHTFDDVPRSRGRSRIVFPGVLHLAFVSRKYPTLTLRFAALIKSMETVLTSCE